jgi:hypothetical protein
VTSTEAEYLFSRLHLVFSPIQWIISFEHPHAMRIPLILTALFLLFNGPTALIADSTSSSFTTAQSVADLSPDDAEIKTAGQWNPVGIDQASQGISRALHQTATFHLKIVKFEPYHKEGWAYRMQGSDQMVFIRGSKVRCHIWIYFRKDQTDVLARVHKGAVLTFSGTLGRADLRMNDQGAAIMSIDLYDGQIASDEVL